MWLTIQGSTTRQKRRLLTQLDASCASYTPLWATLVEFPCHACQPPLPGTWSNWPHRPRMHRSRPARRNRPQAPSLPHAVASILVPNLACLQGRAYPQPAICHLVRLPPCRCHSCQTTPPLLTMTMTTVPVPETSHNSTSPSNPFLPPNPHLTSLNPKKKKTSTLCIHRHLCRRIHTGPLGDSAATLDSIATRRHYDLAHMCTAIHDSLQAHMSSPAPSIRPSPTVGRRGNCYNRHAWTRLGRYTHHLATPPLPYRILVSS